MGREKAKKNDLAKVTLMQEISWRQKSRAIWLKEVDHNTKSSSIVLLILTEETNLFIPFILVVVLLPRNR
jgi:hypothetical protein